MSYNITKVSSKTANSTGDITLNVADVTSVSSPQPDQILGYNGSNWVNRSANWVNAYELGARTAPNSAGATQTYDYPIPNTFLPAGEQYFYQFGAATIGSTTYNNIYNTADVTITTNSSGNWIYKVVLNNAGLYRLWCKTVIGSSSSTTSSLEAQWSNGDNSVKYGPRVRIHKYSEKLLPVIGYINASGGESVGLYLHANNNNAKHTTESTNVLCIIEKLS